MRRSLQRELLAAASLVLLAASRSTLAEPAPQRAKRRAEPQDVPAAYRKPREKAQWKSETYGRRQK